MPAAVSSFNSEAHAFMPAFGSAMALFSRDFIDRGTSAESPHERYVPQSRMAVGREKFRSYPVMSNGT